VAYVRHMAFPGSFRASHMHRMQTVEPTAAMAIKGLRGEDAAPDFPPPFALPEIVLMRLQSEEDPNPGSLTQICSLTSRHHIDAQNQCKVMARLEIVAFACLQDICREKAGKRGLANLP
jgi:hypothetical protein